MLTFRKAKIFVGFTIFTIFNWYGANSTAENSKKIISYAYKQEMISSFDKFMICFEGHIKSYFINGLYGVYTVYGYPFHKKSFEENKKKIPGHWLPPRCV